MNWFVFSMGRGYVFTIHKVLYLKKNGLVMGMIDTGKPGENGTARLDLSQHVFFVAQRVHGCHPSGVYI